MERQALEHCDLPQGRRIGQLDDYRARDSVEAGGDEGAFTPCLSRKETATGAIADTVYIYVTVQRGAGRRSLPAPFRPRL